MGNRLLVRLDELAVELLKLGPQLIRCMTGEVGEGLTGLKDFRGQLLVQRQVKTSCRAVGADRPVIDCLGKTLEAELPATVERGIILPKVGAVPVRRSRP